MSITGINTNYSTLSIYDLYGVQDTDSVSGDVTTSSSISSSSVNRCDSLDLSKPSEIYSKLQELAKSDPEKLKEVCANIADKLKSESENSDGRDSKMLADLAEKFQSVADGGDVSQLKPPEPPSFSGGPQAPIDQYSKQQDSQTAGLMGQPGPPPGPGNNGDQILSSILDDLNDVLTS